MPWGLKHPLAKQVANPSKFLVHRWNLQFYRKDPEYSWDYRQPGNGIILKSRDLNCI